MEARNVKYPENLPLRIEVFKSAKTIEVLAEELGCSRQLLSRILNGHNKGEKQVAAINEMISKKTL